MHACMQCVDLGGWPGEKGGVRAYAGKGLCVLVVGVCVCVTSLEVGGNKCSLIEKEDLAGQEGGLLTLRCFKCSPEQFGFGTTSTGEQKMEDGKRVFQEAQAQSRNPNETLKKAAAAVPSSSSFLYCFRN